MASELSERARQAIDEIEAGEMRGPNKLAAICEIMISELTALLDRAKGRQRSQLEQRLKSNRMLLRWAKTRAGYAGS